MRHQERAPLSYGGHWDTPDSHSTDFASMTDTPTEYPNDADGKALRRIAATGADMMRPMVIEFSVDVPDETAARAVAEGVSTHGYTASVDRDGEDGCSPSISTLAV